AAPDAAPLPTATAEMMMSVAAEPTDVAAAEAAPEMARVQEDTAAGAPAVKAPSADTDGVMPQVASPDPLEQQAPSVTATGWSVRMVAPIIALLAALVVIAAIIATIRQRARNR
ncbi:MAG TPA: hypothetical protein PKC19_04485, partial [Roseiflexaceae bacterium]|nr:hypothetical protein [Roseiflexaceae bacterium]